MDAEQSHQSARRNRTIAIAAGAITVTAIVVAFAAEYLNLPWKWLRPGVELLLLAELVGLVVLERHQLFEPVSERVAGIEAGMTDVRATLNELKLQLGTAGQITVAVGVRESLQLRTRLLREAAARDAEGPRIIRVALLSGASLLQDMRELGDELQEFERVMSEFYLEPGSPMSSKGHRWSVRTIMTWTSMDGFTTGIEYIRSRIADRRALNIEWKFLVRPRAEALISPTVTDNAVFLGYGDEASVYRWGLALQGRQYVTLFAGWFDDRWAAIPDRYLTYSRGGLNQKAIEMIKREIEANEAGRDRSTA
jgi:hypothetical protein